MTYRPASLRCLSRPNVCSSKVFSAVAPTREISRVHELGAKLRGRRHSRRLEHLSLATLMGPPIARIMGPGGGVKDSTTSPGCWPVVLEDRLDFLSPSRHQNQLRHRRPESRLFLRFRRRSMFAMRVLLSAVGTRGDVQPTVAVAVRIRELGRACGCASRQISPSGCRGSDSRRRPWESRCVRRPEGRR